MTCVGYYDIPYTLARGGWTQCLDSTLLKRSVAISEDVIADNDGDIVRT